MVLFGPTNQQPIFKRKPPSTENNVHSFADDLLSGFDESSHLLQR